MEKEKELFIGSFLFPIEKPNFCTSVALTYIHSLCMNRKYGKRNSFYTSLSTNVYKILFISLPLFKVLIVENFSLILGNLQETYILHL